MIQADALSVFCNVNDFAELVTYYPRSGSQREINAVVNRDAIALIPEDGDAVTCVFEVSVVNSRTTGISSIEIDTGGDMISFSPRVGEPVSRRSITRILSHDEGMLVLECR
jgi:hypothetical protein